jgi:hypothetical protein
MSLAETLQKLRQGAEERIPAPARSRMHQATEELRHSQIMAGVFKAGNILPPFRLPNWHGTEISSRELLAEGNLVITFYRGVW